MTARFVDAIRFQVKCVPIPNGGFIVADTRAAPVRLHAGGVLYPRYQLQKPHSSYYETLDEARTLAEWLDERARGYPINLVLCDPTIRCE